MEFLPAAFTNSVYVIAGMVILRLTAKDGTSRSVMGCMMLLMKHKSAEIERWKLTIRQDMDHDWCDLLWANCAVL